MTDQEQRQRDEAAARERLGYGPRENVGTDGETKIECFCYGAAHGRHDSEGYRAGIADAARVVDGARFGVHLDLREIVSRIESLATTGTEPVRAAPDASLFAAGWDAAMNRAADLAEAESSPVAAARLLRSLANAPVRAAPDEARTLLAELVTKWTAPAGHSTWSFSEYLARARALLSSAPPVAAPAKCRDLAPAGHAGHWRDWHRGHSCALDPERVVAAPRTAEQERADVVAYSRVRAETNRPQSPGVAAALESFGWRIEQGKHIGAAPKAVPAQGEQPPEEP